MRLFLDLWRENCGRRKNLVEVLELLSSLVLIRVGYTLAIDLCYIWETVDDKSSQKNSIRDLIVLNRKTSESLESLKL